MRTIMLRGVLTAAILLALSMSTAYAQSYVGGKVVDAENKPVEGAVVVFEQKGSKNKRDTKTDKKGEFFFIGLASGEYTVTASKGGLTDSQPANISGAQKSMLNFQLKAAAATTVQTTSGLTGAASGSLPKGEAPKEKADVAALQATAAAAVEAVKANRHEEAVAKLNEVLAAMPTCADCYMYLGVSQFGLNKFPEAEAAFKKSVELQPTVEGYTMLVRFYNSQKQFDLAEQASKKANELSAQVNAQNAAGAAASTAKSGAPADPAAAAAPAGANSETLYNQGVVLWNAGKYAEAKPQFEAAVKADPKNAEAQYMLGMASLNTGQIPQARTAFQAYLDAAPTGPKAAEVKTFLSQLPK